jgi:Tol biopolymer transport system component
MPGATIPTSWSNDGQLAVFFNSGKQTGYDLWIQPFSGDRKAYPFLQTPANEWNGRLSPDNHWLAYQSDETGTYEIYVTTFPSKQGKWQISTHGGSRPVWNRDGAELFYIAADQEMMAVRVKAGARFDHGTPAPLFEARTWALEGYDVSPDGKRFLMVSPVGQDSSASMNVLVNWQTGLRK